MLGLKTAVSFPNPLKLFISCVALLTLVHICVKPRPESKKLKLAFVQSSTDSWSFLYTINTNASSAIQGTIPFHNYTLVLATQVKNQTAYLAEWIQHHQLIGVDRIVIYNDQLKPSSESKKMRFIADPWIKEGFVEWIDWPALAFELDQPPFGPRHWTFGDRGQARFNRTLHEECLVESTGVEWHRHSSCQRAAFIDVMGKSLSEISSVKPGIDIVQNGWAFGTWMKQVFYSTDSLVRVCSLVKCGF